MQIAVLTIKAQLTHAHAKGNHQHSKRKKLPPAEVGSSPSAAGRETEKRRGNWIKTCFISLTQSGRFDLSINCEHFLRVIPPKIHGAQGNRGQAHPLLEHPAGGKAPGCCGKAEPGAVSRPLLRPSLPAGFWSTAFDHYALVVQD